MNLLRGWEDRIFAALLISLVEYGSSAIIPFVPRNDFYFLVCGGFNFVTLLVLTGYEKTELVVDLCKLVYLQLCVQFVGWVLYSFYCGPSFYNFAIHVVVVATYIRILLIGERDEHFKNDPDRSIFSLHVDKWGSNRNEVHQC